MTAFMLAGCTHDVYDAAGEATPKPSSTQPHVATLGQWIEHPTKFMRCTGVTSGGAIDYAPGRGADTAEGAVRAAFGTMYDQVPYHLQKVSSGTLPNGDGFAQYIAFGKDHYVAFTTANLDPKNLTWRASYVDGCEHHNAFGIPSDAA